MYALIIQCDKVDDVITTLFVLNLAPLEIHDHRRGSSYEESSLQADAGPQPVLPRPPATAPHGHASSEQPPRDVGTAEFPLAHHLPVLQHL